MKDLDFDELDRAVNSLMSDKNSPAQNDTSSPAVPATDPSPVASPTAPVQPEPSVVAPVPRQSPPAARRGGRFMDVVPAARKTKDTMPAPISREGTSIQPAGSATSSSSQHDKVMTETPVAKEAPASVATTTDWPDPLELAASQQPSAQKTPEISEQVDISAEAAVELKNTPMPDLPDQEVASVPNDEPLSSPFLPDAKVEKRPLGGAALSSTGGELMVEDENAQLPALPKDVEPALPEELHGDVASIEADNSTTDPSDHIEPSSEPVKHEVSKTEAKKPAVTVTEAIAPAGPTSIPQQYTEEPNSGDQKSGAIYDTDSYHQPLTHPAQKKHGWSWVLWILLILLVGAGGGAALYFLGIF